MKTKIRIFMKFFIFVPQLSSLNPQNKRRRKHLLVLIPCETAMCILKIIAMINHKMSTLPKDPMIIIEFSSTEKGTSSGNQH